MRTFTALTRERVIVVSGGSVTAHQAQFLLLSRRRALLLPPRLAIRAASVNTGRRRQFFPTCNNTQTRGKTVL